MANVEGAIRMKYFGKFVFLCGLIFTVLGAILFLLSWLSRAPLPIAPMAGIGLVLLVYIGILPQVIGGLVWAGGWIVEGFLAPQKPEQSLQ
jgi:hypothetical protein